jgi:hypothetical protein
VRPALEGKRRPPDDEFSVRMGELSAQPRLRNLQQSGHTEGLSAPSRPPFYAYVPRVLHMHRGPFLHALTVTWGECGPVTPASPC